MYAFLWAINSIAMINWKICQEMLCSSLKNLSLRQEGPKLCQGGFHNIEDNGIDDDLVGDDDDWWW